MRCQGTGPRGGRCRNQAGACPRHETLGPVSLADDPAARAALLEHVRTHRACSLRQAAEAAGYHRRDAKQLLDADSEFRDLYREARGYDDDAIRQQIRKRAFATSNPSDRLLLEMARANVAEYREAHRLRFEGKLDVRGVPYLDMDKLTEAEQQTLIALTRKASPDPDALPRDGRPALELIAGGRFNVEEEAN
jgi:hypothetical protein